MARSSAARTARSKRASEGSPTARRPAARRGPDVELHHPEQLWWPDVGLRKRDAIEYYLAVAPVLLAHLRDRPLTIKRHYNGPRSPFEWIKDAPAEVPSWIRRVPLPAKSRGGAPVRYLVVENAEGLAWVVDFGAVDLHVWTSRADRPERPDSVLFDLDPAGVEFADVVRAALLLREALEALGLESVAKTTGGDGLHVHVPIARRYGYDEVRNFVNAVAVALRRAAPDLVTTERSPSRRRGVYVDAKMNGHGQQVVAPYSLRPFLGAPVAAPLRWDEVHEGIDPLAFTPPEVLARVRREGDLFAVALRGRQRLPF